MSGGVDGAVSAFGAPAVRTRPPPRKAGDKQRDNVFFKPFKNLQFGNRELKYVV